MRQQNGLYEVFVKLGSNPDADQQEILRQLGINNVSDTDVYSAIVSISTISKLSSLEFVESVGMLGRPEIVESKTDLDLMN